jgi:hypothetical protein
LRNYRFIRVESEFHSLLDGDPKLNATHSPGTLTNSSNARIGVTYQVPRLPHPDPILNISHPTDELYSTDLIRSHRSDPSSSSSSSLSAQHRQVDLDLQTLQKCGRQSPARSILCPLFFGDAEGNRNVSVKPVQGPVRPRGLKKCGDGGREREEEDLEG